MRKADTDADWELWGQRDPYFGVISNDKYRRKNLTQASKMEFFQSGEGHVHHLLEVCRKYVDKDFAPKSALDFGCGVGRITIPLARVVERVVGLDVADSMLSEARNNRDLYRASNVELLKSDDSLSAVSGSFDLVHSTIVFQHLEPARGRELFRKLLSLLAPGGICAAHFTYGKIHYPATYGTVPPAEAPAGLSDTAQNARDADPLMLMNAYNVNELLFIVQTSGVARIHLEFTDHGGELGVILYFQK
jgi:SAM-dependent methyltransferase